MCDTLPKPVLKPEFKWPTAEENAKNTRTFSARPLIFTSLSDKGLAELRQEIGSRE